MYLHIALLILHEIYAQFAVDDDLLKQSLEEDADRSVRDYVKHVISPYFNVPPEYANSEGYWDAFVRISSDNINEFARNVVYQRRKSMKSAVELAFYEMKNSDNRKNNENGNVGQDGKNVTSANGPSKPDAAKGEEKLKKDRSPKEPP